MTGIDKTVRAPGDDKHLSRLLDAWARAEDSVAGRPVIAGRLRRLVGVLVIVGALDGLRDADGNERIGFKGGAGLELRFGLQARASKDLDATYHGELDDALALISSAMEIGWKNFTGIASDQEEITRPGITPAPVRVNIKLRYKGRSFVTIPFEVSAAEGSSMDSPERLPAAVSLAPVQLEEPETIPFLPIRYQIAQKLHACTEDCGEQTNQRARDLPDLLLIERLAITKADLPAIRVACMEIFIGRAKQAWPPVITAWPDWPQIWTSLLSDENLQLELEEAVAAVQSLVNRIEASGSP